MIETVIVTFVLMFLGFVLGVWISGVFHRSVMREFLNEMGYDTPEKLRELHDKIAQRIADDTAEYTAEIAAGKPVIKIRLEQHQGVIFAYREDDSTFIGQGNTKEDLIASIMHRIRGCRVEITNGELLRENNS